LELTRTYVKVIAALTLSLLSASVTGTVWVMVFNTTFDNISAISRGPFYLWRKPEYPEKNICNVFTKTIVAEGVSNCV
jgi:hypothetical protein